MSLSGFQQALTAMTLDGALAAAVARQQGSPLHAWPLTALEHRRLLAIAQQAGMALNCTLARSNRFAAIYDAYPMSCVLLGPALRAVLDTLWREQPPDNAQLAGDAERYARVVLAHHESHCLSDESTHACLPQVLACERAAYELAQSVRHHPEPDQANSAPSWIDFPIDPQPLFDALQRFEAPPATLRPVPHRVRIQLQAGEMVTTVFEVQTGSH